MLQVKQAYGTGRARLLAATREVLVERGGGSDVEAVVARAGVSKALVWRHFGNRDGLLAAAVEQFWDDFDAAVFDAVLVPEASWQARERERLRAMVDFLLDQPLARVVLNGLAGVGAVQQVTERRLLRHVSAAADNIKRGQGSGDLSFQLDADLAAAFVIGGLHRAVIMAGSSVPSRADLADRLWSSAMGVLAPPPRPGASG